MNRHYSTISAGMLTLALLCSCGNNNSPKNETGKVQIETKAAVENIQTRRIPCDNEFIQITNIGSANIVYTQGDYSIQATGDSVLIDMLSLNFDSGVLTVGINGERPMEMQTINRNSLTLHVSSPELRFVSVCANGGFQTQGTLKTDNFIAGNLGTGEMKFDTITCRTFKFENNYSGSASFNHVKCDKVVFSSFGTSTNTANFIVKNEVDVMSGSTSKNKMNIHTNALMITSQGKSTGDYTVDCQSLKALTTEYAELTLNGKTKSKRIKNAIGSKITDKLTKR